MRFFKKTCQVCNNEIGLNRWKIKDGWICLNCFKKSGLKISDLKTNTKEDIEKAIREREKINIKTPEEHSNINKLPDNVLKSITLLPNERILMWLKGTFKEWLICTDKRAFIVKKGFMTGNTFGGNVFQMFYKNITSVEVNFHLVSGYFEISAGGVQNTIKNYWSTDKKFNPTQAPNCISITNKDLANKFKEACTFITNKIQEETVQNNNTSQNIDIPEQIKKLAELKEQGILTEDEFETKKKELLSKI